MHTLRRLDMALCVSGALCATLSLAAPAGAQVDVPGDFAELQAAIDASPPGAVILVHGGTHPSIVIDKPLTIVGESLPVIEGTLSSFGFKKLASITLAGTGSGTVTLVGLRTRSTLFEGLVDEGEPGILGGGFAQLRVLHCEIAGAGAISASGTEALYGAHGIDVTVPWLVVEDSIVTGGDTLYAFGGQPKPLASTGISAPASTLTLLDSQVTGGLVHDFLWNEFFQPCPGDCGSILGSGGTGIVAAVMHRANSTVAGGAGGTFTCTPSGFVCAKPDGAALAVGSVTDLPDNLSASGPLDEGGSFHLEWTSLGSPALLLVSPLSLPPVQVGAHGLLFLDVPTATIFLVPGGGSFQVDVAIPSFSSLVGLALTLQVYDPVLGLTRPLLAAFVP
jgi:hypothetical protein